MENKEIARTFKFLSKLAELHEENPFKVRSYFNVAYEIEDLPDELADMSQEDIADIPGVGKAIHEKITSLLSNGTFDELERYKADTPPGVIEMMRVYGVGTKKIRFFWLEMNVTSVEALVKACENDEIAPLKGFGPKSQESIKASCENFLEKKKL